MGPQTLKAVFKCVCVRTKNSYGTRYQLWVAFIVNVQVRFLGRYLKPDNKQVRGLIACYYLHV